MDDNDNDNDNENEDSTSGNYVLTGQARAPGIAYGRDANRDGRDGRADSNVSSDDDIGFSEAENRRRAMTPGESGRGHERIDTIDVDDVDLIEYDKGERGHPIKRKCMRLFRSPVTRALVPVLLMTFDLLVYNEDPITYSAQEANVYGLGRIYNYFFRQYPPSDEAFWITWKVFSALLWAVLGAVLGKYLVHDAILRDCLNLGLFKEDMGSWTVMIFSSSFVVFLGSFFYNASVSNHFHVGDGSDNSPYVLNDYLGMKESTFQMIAVVATWLCDLLTWFVIIDAMFQDSGMNVKRANKYGCTSRTSGACRTSWTSNRPAIFVSFIVFTAIAVFFYMGSNYRYGWILASAGHFGWTEQARCWAAAAIMTLDSMIFMQDWEFPKFKHGNNNAQLIGCGSAKRGCRSKRCGTGIEVHGKWLNYVPWILMTVLNFNLFFNQFSYVPENYLQIADSDAYVRNVYGSVPFPTSAFDYSGFPNGTSPGDGGGGGGYKKFFYDALIPRNVSGAVEDFFVYVGCNETYELGRSPPKTTDPGEKPQDRYAFPGCIMCVSRWNVTSHDDGRTVSNVSGSPETPAGPGPGSGFGFGFGFEGLPGPGDFSCYNVSYRFDIKHEDIPIQDKLLSLGPVVLVFTIFVASLAVSAYRSAKCSPFSRFKRLATPTYVRE